MDGWMHGHWWIVSLLKRMKRIEGGRSRTGIIATQYAHAHTFRDTYTQRHRDTETQRRRYTDTRKKEKCADCAGAAPFLPSSFYSRLFLCFLPNCTAHFSYICTAVTTNGSYDPNVHHFLLVGVGLLHRLDHTCGSLAHSSQP